MTEFSWQAFEFQKRVTPDKRNATISSLQFLLLNNVIASQANATNAARDNFECVIPAFAQS